MQWGFKEEKTRILDHFYLRRSTQIIGACSHGIKRRWSVEIVKNKDYRGSVMMPKMDGVRISSCVRPGQKDAMADEIETHYFIQRVLDQCSDRNSDRIKRWF